MLARNSKNREIIGLKGFEDKCPNGSDYSSDCPIFGDNSPCKLARRCKLRIVESRYKAKKWNQKKLILWA